jgi:nucleoside-diphosphate-sugar epimerase
VAGVLITGGSGLIGRRVVEAFDGARSAAPVVVGRADADLLQHGEWDRLFETHLPDVVVHLAWSASGAADYRNHGDNDRWVRSTLEGVDAAIARGIRFLATGTSVDGAPAADAYSRSKARLRAALQDRISAGDIGWLRPFYVFDEDRPSPAVLRAALAATAQGAPVRLANPGARRDFIHSRDAGTAIRTALEAGLTGSIDIGSGRTCTVAELVEAYGCRWIADGTPSTAAASETAADVEELRDAGWSPEVTDRRLGRSA